MFYWYDKWNDEDCTDSFYAICESDMVLPLAGKYKYIISTRYSYYIY